MYTSWEPEVNMVLLEDVVEKVVQIAEDHDVRFVVLTGGEPTIQNLELLVLALKERGFYLQVETNGTGEIPEGVDEVVCSPKLSDSVPEVEPERTMHERARGRALENMKQAFKEEKRPIWLKFVIAEGTDLSEILDFIAKVSAPKERIFFMPECITKKEFLERMPRVAALAQKHSVRFAPRLHFLLWDDERGK